MPRLENSAGRMVERYFAYFSARDWAAIAEMLADDICMDDRRRVVNTGIRHGREAEMAGLRATASVGTRFSNADLPGDARTAPRSRQVPLLPTRPAA